jgi:glycine cleavage system H protein
LILSRKINSRHALLRRRDQVRVTGDTATVGITDHAQHALTDIVFVELPDIGKKVKAGDG